MTERAELTEQALLWREPDRRGGGPVDHPAGEITLGSRPSLAVRVAALTGGDREWCPDPLLTSRCTAVGSHILG